MIVRSHRSILVIIALLSLIISTPSFSEDTKTDETEIEGTAKSYMAALFHEDIDSAASYMHPETLDGLRRQFLTELDKAKAAGQESQFLAKINVKIDGDALRILNSKDLFVTLVESDHRKHENAVQKMKESTVDVVSSKLLQNGEVIVQLKVSIPIGNRTTTQNTGLLLAKVDDKWKVKGDAL
jgi:hypothetical protein